MTHDSQPERYGALWSRDELVLAFDLYRRIPFRMATATNPKVVELASLLDRSPASVSRKLGNFGSFDPELQEREISGLTHAGKLDKEVWDEFNSDWNGLVLEARRLRNEIAKVPPADPQEGNGGVSIPEGASEREAIRKTRIHQAFFRAAVLSNYEETCCITGLRITECLVASHIIPWGVSEQYRADPRNGLCLSATFDRLFDCGLMTLSHDLRVVVSSGLRSVADKRAQEMICAYHGAPILKPSKFLPLRSCLEWHRNNVFHD